MPTLHYGNQSEQRRDDAVIRSFRDDRVGQFIHWGLYSLPAGVWHGITYDFAAEFLPKSAKIPPSEWERLASEFTIENFDADQWAQTATDLGARYVTITTKHHEGFCLWPSRYSDLTIASTPAGADGRDVLGEIIRAYERVGISVHLYYSVLDWHHPDWRYSISSRQDETAFLRYLEFAKNQLAELAVRYPSVRGFWFDGTWDESVKQHGAWTWEIEHMLKELIPGVLVNSRLRADDFGNRHFDVNGEMMGDFESGFERRLPHSWDTTVAERDWEACLTQTQGSWGYHRSPAVEATRKGPAEIVDLICHATSLGGNCLINFGPDGNGSIRPEEVALAQSVGAWLAQNGKAIYGCTYATGWQSPQWGYWTFNRERDRYFAIITRAPIGAPVILHLPADQQVEQIDWLDGPSQVDYRLREHNLLAVKLPANLTMPVVLELQTQPWRATRQQVNPDVVE